MPDPDGLERRVETVLARLSLDEKLHQLSGDVPFSPRGILRLIRYNSAPFPSGRDPDHGIPSLEFADGPRGVVLGRSTAFPVSMGRGATWAPDLEERVGDAIGVELRSQGARLFGGVCVNLLRHPGWGRAQETYGEDPVHVGEMGAALVRGTQRHVVACVKHFACNSIENSRFKVSVEIDERTLREVYLPHFERCVEAGAGVVMTAYNRINGTPCGHHAHLNRDILKGDWGFEGFTLSDFFFGVHQGVAGIRGGLDVEMPIARRYGRRLRRAVQRGDVEIELIDDAVRRVVRTKFRFEDVGEPDRYGPDAVASPEHRALAREVATKAMVLLRNERIGGRPALPIEDGARVAVIGELASIRNIGDMGSSKVTPPETITLLDGLRQRFGDRLVHVDSDDTEEAAAAAREVDVAIVIAGYTYRDEGEYVWIHGGDRTSLRLLERQERVLQATAAVNPRTVAVVVTGSAIVSEAWREQVGALVIAWYPGMEGGRALADLLAGDAEFTGRLPCSFPRDEAHLPPFDPKAKRITYEYLHGHRWIEAHGHAPAYPLGFGLSYTTFTHGAPSIEVDDVVQVRVEVTNVGERPGAEVVQVYATRPDAAPRPQPPRFLVGFARVEVAAGSSEQAVVQVPVERLRSWIGDETGGWELVPGSYTFGVGPSSDPATHQVVSVDL